jgi:hypothetical protein
MSLVFPRIAEIDEDFKDPVDGYLIATKAVRVRWIITPDEIEWIHKLEASQVVPFRPPPFWWRMGIFNLTKQYREVKTFNNKYLTSLICMLL